MTRSDGDLVAGDGQRSLDHRQAQGFETGAGGEGGHGPAVDREREIGDGESAGADGPRQEAEPEGESHDVVHVETR